MKNIKEKLLVAGLILSFVLASFCFLRLEEGIWPVTGISFSLVLALMFTANLLHLFSFQRKQIDSLTQQLLEYDRLATTGRMAAGIAHELNNPLSVMQQNSGWMNDLLEDGLAGKECSLQELSDSIKRIDSQISRAQTTIRNMLGYVRNLPPELVPVDLNTLLQRTATFLDPLFRQKEVECSCLLEPDIPTVLTNSEMLQQIFVNILGNAVDATCNGGKIEIITSRQNDQARIEISDNGPGIPAEKQKQIFEPFFTTKEEKGTGLGLWICSQIIKKLQGEFFLHKSDPSGTTFMVVIPLAKAQNTEIFPENKN